MMETAVLHTALGGRRPDKAYYNRPTFPDPGLAPDQGTRSNVVRMAA